MGAERFDVPKGTRTFNDGWMTTHPGHTLVLYHLELLPTKQKQLKAKYMQLFLNIKRM